MQSGTGIGRAGRIGSEVSEIDPVLLRITPGDERRFLYRQRRGLAGIGKGAVFDLAKERDDIAVRGVFFNEPGLMNIALVPALVVVVDLVPVTEYLDIAQIDLTLIVDRGGAAVGIDRVEMGVEQRH